MAGADRVPFLVRVLSPAMTMLLRLGLPLGPGMLLTVRGRTTGRPRTIPVAVLEHDGHRWLVAIFGEVGWVRNLRAASVGVLSRGRRRQTVVVEELAPEAAGRVIKDAVRPHPPSRLLAAFLRRYVEVSPDAALEDFIEKARRHPVFELHRPSRVLDHSRPFADSGRRSL